MTDTTVTDAQLQAAFLAARGEGKILADDVLRAIILAAREVERTEATQETIDSLAAKRRAYRTPEWLRERVNDPYGTPNKHEFWGTVVVVRMGVYKLFTRGGWAYAYDTQHNAWLHFASESERAQHCAKPAIDPWA